MGHRSAGETIAGIFIAFVEQRTWSQADLARRCGVSVRALRVRLLELERLHVPFEVQSDPPQVYWSVPKNWYPNGRLLEPEDVALVARLLNRLPRSKESSRALKAVLGVESRTPAYRVQDDRTAEVLGMLEEAAQQQQTVTIDYYSASRGDRGERDVSVHRILYGDQLRAVATCHRSGTLKFFRIDDMTRARIADRSAYRPAASEAVTTFLETSINGYRAPREVTVCTFSVRFPEARWVKRNLPQGPIEAEPTSAGLRFTSRTAAVEPLARFVVGLGAAARAESPELREHVERLALEALDQLRPPRKVNTKSVRLNRATE